MKSRFAGALGKLDWLFATVVVAPTLIAVLYYGLFASDVYISESRFVVRSPEKPAASGIGIMLKSAGFTNAGDEIFAAKDYITSRDALAILNKDGAFQKAYGNDAVSIFDRFDPLGLTGTGEDLYRYFTGKVAVQHDVTSSITTLSVRAYSAQDAYRFNRQLLEQSEALVNRLNDRGRKDLIGYAEAEVDEARDEASRAAVALASYRNRKGVIDPERQATVQLQMISKLQDELIGARNQLFQLRATVPGNPQIRSLEMRAKSLEREIDGLVGSVAGDTRSLSATAVEYQRLSLERDLADKRLAAAMTSLLEARNEARRKQAYVERIVQPNVPDASLEPRRIRSILATFVLGLVAWGVLGMLLAGVREHRE